MSPPDRHRVVREVHEATVLHAILDHAPTSRSKLVEITGLSKPTVLNIVRALEAAKLIRPVDRQLASAGRPAERYEANPRAGFAIGIDFGGTKVRAAMCDLVGRTVEERSEATAPAGGLAVLEQLVRMSRDLARAARVPWRAVRVVAVGCPGFVASGGGLSAAVNVANFDGFPLGELLRQALRVNVIVENDVNVAAYGELASGNAGDVQNLAVLSVGTGVGAGIIIDGQVVRGSRGAAGEISYLPIGHDPATQQSRRLGSLELVASGPAMERALRAELAKARHKRTALTTRATPADIFDAAANSDPLAVALVDNEAKVLAMAILSITAVCDPDVFILAGGVGANPHLLGPVRAAVDGIAPFPIRVETSLLGEHSGVAGALALARNRAWQLLFTPTGDL